MKRGAIRRFVCDEWGGGLRSEMGLDRLEHTPRHSLCKIFEWVWCWREVRGAPPPLMRRNDIGSWKMRNECVSQMVGRVTRVAFEVSIGRVMAVSGIGHAVRIVHDAYTARNRKERVDTRHERS